MRTFPGTSTFTHLPREMRLCVTQKSGKTFWIMVDISDIVNERTVKVCGMRKAVKLTAVRDGNEIVGVETNLV